LPKVLSGLFDVQTVYPGSAFVGPDSLPRLPQVLFCQHRHQQRRPCASGFMPRATGFVADRTTGGFTAGYADPPRLRGHLTPCLSHRHVLEHAFSFGPSSRTGDYYGRC